MRLVLGKKWREHLGDLPEDGMGYQIVDVELTDGNVLQGITALNGIELVLPVETNHVKAGDIVGINRSLEK